jgi:hypothetical protein
LLPFGEVVGIIGRTTAVATVFLKKINKLLEKLLDRLPLSEIKAWL